MTETDINCFLRLRSILEDGVEKIATKLIEKTELKYDFIRTYINKFDITVCFYENGFNIYNFNDESELDRVVILYSDMLDTKKCLNKLLKSRVENVRENEIYKLKNKIDQLKNEESHYNKLIKTTETEYNNLLFELKILKELENDKN